MAQTEGAMGQVGVPINSTHQSEPAAFRTGDGLHATVFDYGGIKGLDEKYVEAFKKVDSDGDGSISLSEMLHLLDRHVQVKSDLGLSRRAVGFLAMSLVILIFAMFVSSFTGAWFFKDSETQGDYLVAKGSSDVIQTAEATSSVPLSLSSFLNVKQLSRVKEIALTNFQDAATTTADCPDCPASIVLQTTVAVQHNETYVQFLATHGVTVTVHKGEIQVENLPGFAGRTLLACGSATCSTISVDGVDLASLEAKAAPFKAAQRRTLMEDEDHDSEEEEDVVDAMNRYYGDDKKKTRRGNRRGFSCW